MAKVEKYMTDRHAALRSLRESRTWETALGSFLDGKIERDDLTDTEQDIYERFLWVWSMIKQQTGRFDRDTIVEQYQTKYGHSISTANRLIAFVNIRRRMLNEAESELQKYQLYNVLWDSLEKAKEPGTAEDGSYIPENGDLVAKLGATIDKLMGYGREKTEQIDPKKMEQHINILVADSGTTEVLIALRDQNIDKYNPSLEEIIAAQQNIEHGEYEEIEDRSAERGNTGAA